MLHASTQARIKIRPLMSLDNSVCHVFRRFRRLRLKSGRLSSNDISIHRELEAFYFFALFIRWRIGPFLGKVPTGTELPPTVNRRFQGVL